MAYEQPLPSEKVKLPCEIPETQSNLAEYSLLGKLQDLLRRVAGHAAS